MKRLLKIFGIILVLGGLAHSVGVSHFYFMEGVPDANRVLLDIWIAEAQLLGGVLYLVASRDFGGKPSRLFAVFGAVTVIAFAIPMLPVLFWRAPFLFRVPAMVYLAGSIIVLAYMARPMRHLETTPSGDRLSQ